MQLRNIICINTDWIYDVYCTKIGKYRHSRLISVHVKHCKINIHLLGQNAHF